MLNDRTLIELDRHMVKKGGLRQFIKLAWPQVEPSRPFISGWHIDAIAEHLTRSDVVPQHQQLRQQAVQLDRQVAALMVERLPSQPGHGRIHMVVGVIPAWPAYEVEKQAWIRDHPTATQAEYEAAMRSITEKLGV